MNVPQNIEMFGATEIKKLLHLFFMSALIIKNGEVCTTD